MRPDVKLGVIVATGVVLLIGGYFVYRDDESSAIPVTTGTPALTEAARPSSSGETNAAAERKSGGAPSRLADKSGGSAPGTAPMRRVVPPTVRLPGRDTGANGGATRPDRTGAPLLVEGSKNSPANGGATSTDGKTSEPGPSVDSVTTPNPADASGAAGPDRLADAGGAGSNSPVTPSTSGPGARGAVPLTAISGADRETEGGPDGAAAIETHRVQSGDTLITLAERYYGSARYMSLLQSANPQIVDPRNLPAGLLVKIPPRPAEAADKSAEASRSVAKPGSPGPSRNAATPSGAPPTGARTYVVKPGDSFYKIARDVLGDATRWQELFELNRSRVNGDPRSLQIGQVIVLP